MTRRATAALLLLAALPVACSGGPDLTIDGDDVLLATGDLDVRFAKGDPFEETYMLFGGTELDERNALFRVSVAGLSVRDARPIYRRYPDFHRCASPGASLAKKSVMTLNIVPANKETLSALTAGLDEFEENLRNDGGRVCIHVTGSEMRLSEAVVREAGEDVSASIPIEPFHLVESAGRVDCREALDA